MPLAAQGGPTLFTCPKCRKVYLGHEVLPDCPACGYDYRVRDGFRWDMLVYVFSILGLMGYFLVSSSYRSATIESLAPERISAPVHGEEKLPGRRQLPIEYPPSRDVGRG